MLARHALMPMNWSTCWQGIHLTSIPGHFLDFLHEDEWARYVAKGYTALALI